jgi:hypothetical protein
MTPTDCGIQIVRERDGYLCAAAFLEAARETPSGTFRVIERDDRDTPTVDTVAGNVDGSRVALTPYVLEAIIFRIL